MKSTVCAFLAVAAAFLLGLPGCKKASPQPATQDRYGIGIDWPKLDSEFRNNDPAIQAATSSIKRAILYHQFLQAIADLEKLATNPNLTDPQKKIVLDLRDQTQRVMAKGSSSQAQ